MNLLTLHHIERSRILSHSMKLFPGPARRNICLQLALILIQQDRCMRSFLIRPFMHWRHKERLQSLQFIQTRFADGEVTVGSKQKVGNVVVPSIIDQERTDTLDKLWTSSRLVKFPIIWFMQTRCKQILPSEAGNGKTSAKCSRGNQKNIRESKIL